MNTNYIIDFFKEDKVFDDNSNDNFIYLLKEREFVKSGENVYKLGKTSNPKNRLSAYPKGSMILFLTVCNDCGIAEKELLSKFRSIFIQRLDIGREYFEGGKFDMLRILYHYFTGEF